MKKNEKPALLLLDDWDYEPVNLPFFLLGKIKRKSYINFNLVEAIHIVNNEIHITIGGRHLIYPNTLYNQNQLGISEKIGFFNFLRE